MAEDFDFDRVITDPDYRRLVIDRLNTPMGLARSMNDLVTGPDDEPVTHPVSPDPAAAD